MELTYDDRTVTLEDETREQVYWFYDRPIAMLTHYASIYDYAERNIHTHTASAEEMEAFVEGLNAAFRHMVRLDQGLGVGSLCSDRDELVQEIEFHMTKYVENHACCGDCNERLVKWLGDSADFKAPEFNN